MIKNLFVKGAPCFPPEGVEISKLNSINFFFGSNGTGKTTISRALRDPDKYPGTTIDWARGSSEPEIRVYNRDYVRETFFDVRDLPGVFLLGSENKEAREEIERLIGKGGEITGAKAELRGLEESLSQEAGKRDLARKKLSDAGWKKREDIPEELSEMFAGFRNSKEKFVDKLLEPDDEASLTLAREDLIRESKSAFDEAAQPIAELSTATHSGISQGALAHLLGKELVGSKEGTLSQLIEELNSSDWVAQGQIFLKREPEICPFCQQDAPSSLLGDLAAYFDERYSKQVEQLHGQVASYRENADSLLRYLGDLIETKPGYLDVAALRSVHSDLNAAIAENLKRLEKKLENPSLPMDIEDLGSRVEVANRIIEEANSAIRDHNSKVRNRSEARTKLIANCWTYFRSEVVASELAVHGSSTASINKAIEALERKVALAGNRVGSLDERRRKLEDQIVTSGKAIEEINSWLDQVGFSSFHLAESEDLVNGYRLLRNDGAPVDETLSEGERTFVTFLYFFHDLQSQSNDGDPDRGLVAVIDDPISSLDSDIMFVVSQLLMEIMKEISEQRGRVRQLMILTHNAYFHKEVSFVRQNDSGSGRRYYVVRRIQGDKSNVVVYSENPIKTSYGRLWEEIRRATDSPGDASIGLQNTMRRILESYFRILGRVSNDDILTQFDSSERLICRSLFSWLNDGSHSIVEEIDYSPSENSVDLYLQVFKKIFVVTEHISHYEMMMNEKDLVPLVV